MKQPLAMGWIGGYIENNRVYLLTEDGVNTLRRGCGEDSRSSITRDSSAHQLTYFGLVEPAEIHSSIHVVGGNLESYHHNIWVAGK